MKEKTTQYLLYVTLALITASYLPWFYLQPAYYMLRYAIMGCVGGAFVLTFSLSDTLSNKFMQLFACGIGWVALTFLVFIIGRFRHCTEDLSQLVIAFMSISIGLNLKKDTGFWVNVSYIFTILLIVMGFVNCYYYAKGFYIPEHYLLDKGKNQIGALIAMGAAANFFYGMKIKEQRAHFWIVFVLAFELLLLIRARSAVFALIPCVLLIVCKEGSFKGKWNWRTAFSIVGAAMACYVLFTGFIGDELTTFFQGGKNLDANAADTLTSNRWERNLQGISFFCSHPFSGELVESSGIKLIHNYLILRMVRYGIWAVPFFVIYICFGLRTLKGIFAKRRCDIADAGFYVLVVPFAISMLEPSFPYGPGSVQLLAFLLFGHAINSNKTSSLL